MYEDSIGHGKCAWAAWTAYVDGVQGACVGGGMHGLNVVRMCVCMCISVYIGASSQLHPRSQLPYHLQGTYIPTPYTHICVYICT